MAGHQTYRTKNPGRITVPTACQAYTVQTRRESSPNLCPGCGRRLSPRLEGDHCPNCLAAIHREDEEGLPCGGLMEPVGIWVRENDAWEIVERCRFCGEMTTVEMSEKDNLIKVMSIASIPLSSPPFPIERLEELTRIMGGRGELRRREGEKKNEQRK